MPNQINASDIAVKKIDILSATSRFTLIPSLVELIIYEDILFPLRISWPSFKLSIIFMKFFLILPPELVGLNYQSFHQIFPLP